MAPLVGDLLGAGDQVLGVLRVAFEVDRALFLGHGAQE
jgi:hypothetical protein